MKWDTERKITVEDLIRLKKAERPPAEFWTRFESEMRSKQLSAIVNKRPWWQGLSIAVSVVNRHQLQFGAAAALALTWAGVHYLTPSTQAVHSGIAAAPAARAIEHAAVASVPAPSLPAVVRESRPQAVAEVSPQESPATRIAAVTATSSHLTQAPAELAVDAPSKSPFADGIAVTLADYREAAPEFAGRSVFGSDREFEPSAPARQAPSEPLARMDPASERRARLLAPALPAYSSASTRALASDWMKARASSDEKMYESMDRGSNDRMLVGFRF